jgi:outer membrane protein assembly factor BamB
VTRALLFLLIVAGLAAMPGSVEASYTTLDWPVYGFDTARSNDATLFTGINARNVTQLARQQVTLDGTVDSSPIYLYGVTVGGAKHNVFFVTTTYGKTEAIDADTGTVLWTFTPPTYSDLAGTAQITNATPAADPSRTAVYAAAPDGMIRKLDVSDGSVEWATSITQDPTHEKITSSLNVANGLVYATTGGYIGDAPPYQGHVVSLDAGTGQVDGVWNSLCADRHALIDPATCDASDSAIWSRNGVAIDPQTGELVVASGNGPYDGVTNFGDSVAVLSPDAATLNRFWAPANQQFLDDADLDLGSTSPAFLPNGFAVQGGKDGLLKLLQLHGTIRLVQTIALPGKVEMFSEPAVYQGQYVFVSVSSGTLAFRFAGGKLTRIWSNATAGTSPVVAGGLLYVAGNGQVHIYVPTTGRQVATLDSGEVHWQSPIVVLGRIAMPEGDANAHETTGVLDIYRVQSYAK